MSRYWTTLVDKSEGQTHLAFPNNDLTSFFVTRESSHVQLRMSLIIVVMGTLLEFQVIFFPKFWCFPPNYCYILTLLVGVNIMNAMFNMKGTKVLGTHYSLPNIHFRVLSLMLKIVCPNIIKAWVICFDVWFQPF